MSSFIENSKHAAMTSAVEDHILGSGSKRSMPGAASGKGFNQGGDSQYNSVPLPMGSDTGVNYTPPGQAGHTVAGLPAGVKPK